jgi:hypothetical protein
MTRDVFVERGTLKIQCGAAFGSHVRKKIEMLTKVTYHAWHGRITYRGGKWRALKLTFSSVP